MIFVFVLPGPGTQILEEDWLAFDRTFKQRQFSKEEFHYLNVTQVGTFTVYDLFDCTFECLRNALCLSINTAASKGADGKLWCELLSSDKYRNTENYKENERSHHFSIKVSRAWPIVHVVAVVLTHFSALIGANKHNFSN